MRSLKILFACPSVARALGGVTTAGAAALVSPPLRVGDADGFVCEILNVSTKTRAVRIETYQEDGSLVFGFDVQVAAGAMRRTVRPGASIAGSGYCKFIVEGSKDFLPRRGPERQFGGRLRRRACAVRRGRNDAFRRAPHRAPRNFTAPTGHHGARDDIAHRPKLIGLEPRA
jgi:hypothetical protein